MMAHVVEIQTQIQQGPDGEPTGVFRYRWRCSAGCKPGPWCAASPVSGAHAKASRRARNGGMAHVRAMERGKR